MYHDKEKAAYVFFYLDDAFDSVQKIVLEWVMKNKGIPQVRYLMMLCLNETIDRLAMANCVHWYGCVELEGCSCP